MRILFISDAYVPIPTGVAVSMESLRISLEKLGHKVFVLAPKYRGYKENRDFVGRLSAVFKSSEPFAPLIWPIRKPDPKQIKALKIDLVHSHFNFGMFELARYVSRVAGVPHISTFYKIFPEVAKLNKSRRSYNKSLLKTFQFAESLDHAVTFSQKSKQFLIDKMGISTPIDVIPIGIFPKDFTSFPQEAVKKKFGIPETRKVVLFVGSCDEEGNLALLLKSFKKVWKALDEVHLLVVGSGRRLADFKRIVAAESFSKFVSFAGLLPKNQINKIFGAADILVNPGYLDPEPLVILESLAAGTPVVSVKGMGAQEFVKDEVDGLVTEPNVDDFSEKIIELLRRDGMRLEFSQKARALSREFRSSNKTEDLVDLYTKTIENYQHKIYKK